MAAFTPLVIFSLLLLQVAGVAFPTIILQQHDGVFPNVTNSTGTVSVVSPTGASVIIKTAGQVKRYNSAGKLIDNDEILPGYGNEKRQRNVCHLSCDSTHLNNICQSAPYLANCDDECSLQATGLVPLDGTIISQQTPAIPNKDQVDCLSHCTCAGGHGGDLVNNDSNSNNLFEGLD
ncbi:hypothetical protein DHEL01_v204799 [Diaporthe helianthi]|uniref:Uncharacterized protein n=1 Tax=Diaporthe helianthi TaxID=158607 RepID=A0A2P5I2T7_DIAHE|nr:hypothetical protein DHEL01_v204799 [Diaporthe helianthi]